MRVVLALALVTALGGCDKLLSLTPVGPNPADARVIDGVPDGAPDAMPPDSPDAMTRLCAGSMYFNTCAEIVGLNALNYGAPSMINTDTDCMTTKSQGSTEPDICMIIGSQITVSANVRVVGSRPLALIALESFQITSGGTIDASSDSTIAGAGANVLSCEGAQGSPQTAGTNFSGGGAGGSFGGPGGKGGAGPPPLNVIAQGGSPISAIFVRGGCRGGKGGANQVGAFASGGSSGGAVYLVARQDLVIDGRVLANGIGGPGGPGNNAGTYFAGGGGGGSGGLIALDATSVQLGGNCLLQASGGGGGGGSTGAPSGKPGGTPDPAAFGAAAPGGLDGASGSDGAGGDGSLASQGQDGVRPGLSSPGQGGSGGGGGGAGHIRIFPAGTPYNGNHEPAPTT